MRIIITLAIMLIFSSISFAGSPPGLQKKGISGIPYSGKTPPGWDMGVKKGWNKEKDWHWNKKTKLWQNNDWKWNTHNHSWERNR